MSEDAGAADVAGFRRPGTCPFPSIGIVGLGLIGGSIARAARRAWPSVSIAGVDRADVLSVALSTGAITRGGGAIEDAIDVDLLVIATPVPQIIECLAAAAAAGCRALVTDVGSTKRAILRAARETRLDFVGGHPVAGAAQGGFGASQDDLFDGRPWIIVPDGAPPAAPGRLESFVTGLGAVPQPMNADDHDRVMAYVSHLPQLLSTVLLQTAGAAIGRDGLGTAGRGFADMTRLASSPAGTWNGILATNADYVAEAAAAFIRALPKTSAELGDAAAIEAVFDRAHRWLDSSPQRAAGDPS